MSVSPETAPTAVDPPPSDVDPSPPDLRSDEADPQGSGTDEAQTDIETGEPARGAGDGR